MRRIGKLVKVCTALSAGLAGAMVAFPSTSGATPTWNRISGTSTEEYAQAGLFRTADGNLHVAWANQAGSVRSLHYSTLSPTGALLNTGKIVSNWGSMDMFPHLVGLPGGGIRAVFTGGNGVGGSPYNNDVMYTATSTEAGTSWKLVNGSLSHAGIPLSGDSSVNTSNGNPVAAWPNGAEVMYHVGVDPHIPASTPDQQVTTPGAFAVATGLARDKDGSVSVAYYNGFDFKHPGYFVDKIFPSQGTPLLAPGSAFTKNDNEPRQVVALAARAGGGLYLAYCIATTTSQCQKINLWHVGASTATVVPGSATGGAIRVCVAPTPTGKLRISWFDSGLNMFRTVKTNTSVTGFGTVQNVGTPPNFGALDTLSCEASKGPLDLVPEVNINVSGFPASYWHIQLP